jgi:hypothetical protein
MPERVRVRRKYWGIAGGKYNSGIGFRPKFRPVEAAAAGMNKPTRSGENPPVTLSVPSLVCS